MGFRSKKPLKSSTEHPQKKSMVMSSPHLISYTDDGPIMNVLNYKMNISMNQLVLQTKTINQPNVDNAQLSLSISHFATDQVTTGSSPHMISTEYSALILETKVNLLHISYSSSINVNHMSRFNYTSNSSMLLKKYQIETEANSITNAFDLELTTRNYFSGTFTIASSTSPFYKKRVS